MKHYRCGSLIYRDDGVNIFVAYYYKMEFFESIYTRRVFNSMVDAGFMKECEPPKAKPFYKNVDFWHNAALITILLILSMGFIFL